ncbi:unnamed protein product [Rangifer tarandus platyrhynchus]|uniref:Uncharacterized protein n=1 Tax=Rangifer tarandus platyrhynchus TaxID=3082113 RepID=A0ACB1MK27_RANTA
MLSLCRCVRSLVGGDRKASLGTQESRGQTVPGTQPSLPGQDPPSRALEPCQLQRPLTDGQDGLQGSKRLDETFLVEMPWLMCSSDDRQDPGTPQPGHPAPLQVGAGEPLSPGSSRCSQPGA